jgi:DNA-binding transcriptional ArsR family regulator
MPRVHQGGATMSKVASTSLAPVFEALSHPYRRRILLFLRAHNQRTEADLRLDDFAPDDRGMVAVQLFHVHLPKLAEAGYIDWDRQENVVRRGPRFGEVAPLVEFLLEHRNELDVDSV